MPDTRQATPTVLNIPIVARWRAFVPSHDGHDRNHCALFNQCPTTRNTLKTPWMKSYNWQHIPNKWNHTPDRGNTLEIIHLAIHSKSYTCQYIPNHTPGNTFQINEIIHATLASNSLHLAIHMPNHTPGNSHVNTFQIIHLAKHSKSHPKS